MDTDISKLGGGGVMLQVNTRRRKGYLWNKHNTG